MMARVVECSSLECQVLESGVYDIDNNIVRARLVTVWLLHIVNSIC